MLKDDDVWSLSLDDEQKKVFKKLYGREWDAERFAKYLAQSLDDMIFRKLASTNLNDLDVSTKRGRKM